MKYALTEKEILIWVIKMSSTVLKHKAYYGTYALAVAIHD